MSRRLAATALGLCVIAPAVSAEEKSCTAEIGEAKATVLVNQCTDISPATHPPCNAANPCELIRSEIQRGCDLARGDGQGDVPDYCAQYPASNEQPSGY